VLSIVIAVILLLVILLVGVWIVLFAWNVFWLKRQDRRAGAGKLPRKLSPRRGRSAKPARTRY